MKATVIPWDGVNACGTPVVMGTTLFSRPTVRIVVVRKKNISVSTSHSQQRVGPHDS